MLPLESVSFFIVTLDNFENRIHIGDSDKNGKFSIFLKKNKNYAYIYILYIGYNKMVLSIKDKKNVNKIIELHLSEQLPFIE